MQREATYPLLFAVPIRPRAEKKISNRRSMGTRGAQGYPGLIAVNLSVATNEFGRSYWKKSVHISRSPSLRYRHLRLRCAASSHGSKYWLKGLLRTRQSS